MPERPATIAAYAAAASLAAITFLYVIGPNYMLDREHHDSGDSDGADSDAGSRGGGGLFSRSRKHTIVGLVNVGNDCFMNSVLQALAPLYDLRLYLIRELHRRETDGRELYESLVVPDPENAARTPTAVTSLQTAPATEALKQMLDALNERPIYRKTASIQQFVWALERAFRAGINRSQQDAQEFLQLVLERIYDEYKAGERVRVEARRRGLMPPVRRRGSSSGSGGSSTSDRGVASGVIAATEQQQQQQQQQPPSPADVSSLPPLDRCTTEDLEPGTPAPIPFPFLGKLESRVECRSCGYQPKPKPTDFVNLTLQIPQHKGSVTLGSCLDTLLMTEYIDDYRCDRCALVHALEERQRELQYARSNARRRIRSEVQLIQHALDTDPEVTPEGIDFSGAQKQQIARTTRIVEYPPVLAIHLSRSIFGLGSSSSTKNATKVSFPETLKLGRTLLSTSNERTYRLVSIVCHKGSSHNCGHYESMRRCVVREPVGTKVNEDVWRWVGYKSRSRTASRTPSTVCNGVNCDAHSGRRRSVDTGRTKGSGATNPHSSPSNSLSPPCPGCRRPDSPAAAVASGSGRPGTTRTQTAPSRSPSVAAISPNSGRSDSLSPGTRSDPMAESQWVKVEPPRSAAPSPGTDSGRKPDPPKQPIRANERVEKKRSTSRLRRMLSRSSANLGGATGNGVSKTKSKEEKKQKKRKPKNDKWFRVSDEKVKQCKTADVLGMQKEVYLLFYELDE